MVDVEILEKYKVDGSSDYTLVYQSEGKDDPFGENVQDSVEIGGEITINLTGEVTMATTMGESLDKILDSYGGGKEATITTYTRVSENYNTSQENVEVSEEEEDEEE